MTIRRIGVLIAVVAGLRAMTACTLASPTNIAVQPDTGDDDGGLSPSSATGSSTATGGPSTCSGAFTKPDVSKLTACGGGKGHCYDKTKTATPDYYNACPDASQVCIPDSVLNASGSAPKSCTSVIGKGGCADPSLYAVPDAEKSQLGMLKQDVCDSGELCVPCNDPTQNNAPTPFCQTLGVYDKPCAGGAAAGGDGGSTSTTGSPLPTCCAGGGKPAGICMPEDAVPEAGRGRTVQDSCTSGDQCVPTAFIPGQGTPKTCSGRFGASGLCLDQCFSAVFAVAGPLLGNDGCGASEVCMPCSFLSVTGMTVPGCN